MQKPRELRLIGEVDADFAKDKEDRKSITGDIVTLGGMITFWSSKKQSIVSLSSTKSEYVACSSHCQEQKFQQMILDEITRKAKKPA